MKKEKRKFILTCLLCVFFIGLIAQKIETSFSLEQPNDSSITIYPNPLQNKSTVSFETKVDGFTRISIYSIDGKMEITNQKGIIKAL